MHNRLKSALSGIATIAAFAIALAATPAQATMITVGSGWQTFGFGGVGSSWDQDFSFSLAATATFKVTDAFLSGDRFGVFENGLSVGQTSAPGSVGDQIGSNYDAAFADPRWSHAAYVLGPGVYDFTGIATESPFGGGGAAVELVAGGVPELGTWAMMILGFGGVALQLRRRDAVALTA
jgi:hypothetical protein